VSSSVVIIDTSILVEILDLQGLAEHPERTRDELERWIEAKATLLLPVAVIIETGNHIAQISGGRKRRSAAKEIITIVTDALNGDSPFAPTPSFDVDELSRWLPRFEELATRGIGLADASLVELWERERALNPARRVLIWSLDKDLSSYDTGEKP
jgi:predicted nucleic acid-binding protein